MSWINTFIVCKKYCKLKLSLTNRENCEGRDSVRWVTWLLAFMYCYAGSAFLCVEIRATKDSRHENWYETNKYSENKRENRGNKSRQAFLRPFMRQRRHLICQAGFHERAEQRLKFVEGISELINREFRACVPTINEHIARGYAAKPAGWESWAAETTHTTIAPKFNYIRILIKQEAYPSLWPAFPLSLYQNENISFRITEREPSGRSRRGGWIMRTFANSSRRASH